MVHNPTSHSVILPSITCILSYYPYVIHDFSTSISLQAEDTKLIPYALAMAARVLHDLVAIRDHKRFLTEYKACFTGRNAVEALITHQVCGITTSLQAATLCQLLLSEK